MSRRAVMAAVSVLLWAVAPRSGPASVAREFDWGPFASRHVDFDGTLRLRAAGPFFESSASPTTTLHAVRPFYAASTNGTSGWAYSDYLWPVAQSSLFRNERSWRCVLAWGDDFDVRDPNSRYRFWILPFYYQGRDAKGQRYLGVLPLGGSVHEFLGRDEIDFVLFPLWMRHSVHGLSTTEWLFPLISKTTGRGIHRFRIVPFYGRSRQHDQYEKKFILWPIYTEARYFYPRSSGGGYVVFPLWGHLKLTDQESWMILPPFFRFSHGQNLDAMLAPWPFVRIQKGRRDRYHLWPLVGRDAAPGVEKSYVLWPFLWREKVDRGETIIRRYKALPFVYYDTVRRRPAPGGAVPQATQGRRFELWPLCSYERDGESRRFRAPDLWPGREQAPVERSWAPLWTAVEHRARGADSDFELLWGLYRHEERYGEMRRTSLFPVVEWTHDRRDGADEAGWSVLKGLLGRERTGAAVEWRLLYLIKW